MSRGGKFSYEVGGDAFPIRHLGLGHYNTCFLLTFEDLTLVVSPELAVLDGGEATGHFPIRNSHRLDLFRGVLACIQKPVQTI